MKKMNNKGFSLVELIIVIAIMAILASALAPQLMKYIEKSRISTDSTTCATIESTVNAALADEAIYSQVAKNIGTTGVTVNITFNDSGAMTISAGANDKLATELTSTLSTLKAPKESGKVAYKVTIASDNNKVGKVSCETVASGGAEPAEG